MGKITGSLPLAARVLIFLLFFLGAGGLISGAMMFIAPDGHLPGFPSGMLKGSPFQDYLIPGMVLFLFVGVFPLLIGYGLVRFRSNLVEKQPIPLAPFPCKGRGRKIGRGFAPSKIISPLLGRRGD